MIFVLSSFRLQRSGMEKSPTIDSYDSCVGDFSTTPNGFGRNDVELFCDRKEKIIIFAENKLLKYEKAVSHCIFMLFVMCFLC